MKRHWMSQSRQVYEREGKLMPIAQRILTMLLTTPGVVTFDAIRYVLWHRKKQPMQLDHYLTHIRKVTGHLIKKHAHVGYELIA